MKTIDAVIDRLLEYNWKIFFIGVAAGLIGMILVRLGVKLPKLVNPLTFNIASPVSVRFESIKPKLYVKKNSYLLHTDHVEPASIDATSDLSSYVVVDFKTGNILAEEKSQSSFSIASLTKVMSAIVALDLMKEDEELPVTTHASEMIPTKIGVVPGEALTVSEVLHAALMTSANDAVEVLRDSIDAKYGNGIFVQAMNEKAEFLGLSHTHFDNPQGFDGKNNYSSAQDLATLSHYALTNYPLISAIVKKDYVTLPANSMHKKFDLYNWNGLVGVYPDVEGVKIGSTGNAGKTTIVLSQRQGQEVLVVALGAPGILERDLIAAELLNVGFEKAAHLPPVVITAQALAEKYASWKYN